MLEDINNDYLLWKRLKAGEVSAFNELYDQYAGMLFSFGRLYLKDRESIKDCIHDLFLDLYKYRKNLTDTNNIKNYLFLSMKRKIQSLKKKNLTILYSDNIKDTENDLKEASSSLGNEDESIERLKKEIDRLPERQQEALVLRFHSELSYMAIADIMEISVESVRTLVYRSVKTLRLKLSTNNEKNPSILLFIRSYFSNKYN